MNTNKNVIRTRFAPSPTGYLHVGGLRTALYNYLFARKHAGVFLLRIEDTDQARLVRDAPRKLLDVLSVFFEWDEGVKRVAGEQPEIRSFGNHAPYIQSERLDIYKKHVERLLETGKAYRCFCSAKRLEEMRKDQESRKEPTRYDGRCRALSVAEQEANLEAGARFVIRLGIDRDRDITFLDSVRGSVSFAAKTLDDQVLMKSDGFPTYHLANVVDDHLMGITHVIRGEEWLPSTPKHILLYEAFGWHIPNFAHIPLLLNPDRSKLSKRQGDVAVEDYLAKGYLPEALLNFVALLGWNPGEGKTQEIFSMDELVDAFDLSHIHKGGAVFDIKKLDWLNAQYIKQLSSDEIFTKALPFLEKKPWFASVEPERRESEYAERVFSIERDRLQKFSDAGEGVKFLFLEPKVAPLLLPWKGNSQEKTREALLLLSEALAGVAESDWTRSMLEKSMLERAGDCRGDFLWPLRIALSGEKQSPPPFEIAWVIGKKATLERIRKAATLLEEKEVV